MNWLASEERISLILLAFFVLLLFIELLLDVLGGLEALRMLCDLSKDKSESELKIKIIILSRTQWKDERRRRSRPHFDGTWLSHLPLCFVQRLPWSAARLPGTA